MFAQARPIPTRLAAAAVAAGVAVAGVPALVTGEAPPEVYRPAAADVLPASAITDLLYRISEDVSAIRSGFALPAEAAVGLAVDAFSSALIAAGNPALLPSLVSYLIQRAVNPGGDAAYVVGSYPLLYRMLVLDRLVSEIPGIGPALVRLLAEVSNSVGDAIAAQLPDAYPAVLAMRDFVPSPRGLVLQAVRAGLLVPVWIAGAALYRLSRLPADAEAAFEAALLNPADFPGLMSYLVRRLVGSNGLLGDVISSVMEPIQTLPRPIGAWGSEARVAMLDRVNAVLDTVLPAEVEPRLPRVMVAAPVPFNAAAVANAGPAPADAPPVATEPPAAASVPQNLGGSGSETTTAVELTVPSPADTVPEKTQEPVSSDESDGKPDKPLRQPVRSGAEHLKLVNKKLGNKFVPGTRGASAEPVGTPISDTGPAPGGGRTGSSETPEPSETGPADDGGSTDSAE